MVAHKRKVKSTRPRLARKKGGSLKDKALDGLKYGALGVGGLLAARYGGPAAARFLADKAKVAAVRTASRAINAGPAAARFLADKAKVAAVRMASRGPAAARFLADKAKVGAARLLSRGINFVAPGTFVAPEVASNTIK